jgi:hypothetical protein
MKKEDKKEYLVYEAPHREFNLDEKVYFFLSNSLDFHGGKVVGFYFTFGKDGEELLWYQIEYLREMRDGTFKKYFATVPSSEIKSSKEEIEKLFEPLRKQRITDAIKNEEKNFEGIKMDIKSAEEAKVEIEQEKENLIKKFEKYYGEYKAE